MNHVARIATLSGISIPNSWPGIILIMTLAVQPSLPWATGDWTPPWVDPVANLQQLFLPVITLGTAYSVFIARMTCSETLDTLSQDYIKAVRAMDTGVYEIAPKGISKNAFIPVMTVIGVSPGQLTNGAILTETVLSLPGIGKLPTLAIDCCDHRIIQVLILFVASVFVFASLVMGVLYAYPDPRVRHDGN